MKLKIKRFDKSIPLPEYKTKGAACLDAYSRETITIKPRQIGYIPLNMAIELPKDHFLLLAARSSTHKFGLFPANGIGIGDSDFKGDADEYKFAVFNFTSKNVVIEKGTRIAQFMVLPIKQMKIVEVDKLTSSNRGGFGSTGHK